MVTSQTTAAQRRVGGQISNAFLISRQLHEVPGVHAADPWARRDEFVAQCVGIAGAVSGRRLTASVAKDVQGVPRPERLVCVLTRPCACRGRITTDTANAPDRIHASDSAVSVRPSLTNY
jgi:hypothetical protein